MAAVVARKAAAAVAAKAGTAKKAAVPQEMVADAVAEVG